MTRPTDRRTILLVELLEGRLPPAAHTLASAELLALGPLYSADVAGYLATPGQHDLYRVELRSGDTLHAAVTAQLAGSGLQPLLRVFDAAGHEVALNNQDGGDPELTVQAATGGSYFVGVSSAGNADYNPKSNRDDDPGTTAGTYTLAVAVRKGQPLAPALAASSFRLAEATAVWGETVHASFSINNRGGAAAGAFTVQLVASADPRFDPAASVELLAKPIEVRGLDAGEEWAQSGYEVTLPQGLSALASAEGDLFQNYNRLASGPITIGLRITPADPAAGGGALGTGRGQRGTDWERLTIVTPQNGSFASTKTDSLTPYGSAAYSFTIPAEVGVGRFTATIHTGRPDAKLALTLGGSPPGRDQVRIVVAGDGVSPTLTLASALYPGSYTLTLDMPYEGDDPAEVLRAREGPRIDYRLVASYEVNAPNARIEGTLTAGGVERYPVAIPDAGQYTATLTGVGLSPRLALYGGPAGDVLVYRTQGPPGGATAELTQYLQPGVYFLEVEGSAAGAFRLSTTFDAAASITESVPVPFGALGVAVGDVNHDGRTDFVVVGQRSPPNFGQLAVVLGTDDGTFTHGPTTDRMLDDPRGLAVADFNGDGHADVAVATFGSSGVAVYLGVGDGFFEPGEALPLDAALGAVAVTAADLNGDGAVDLIVGTNRDGTVRAFLGDGAGRFRAASSVAVGPGPFALAVADLDGDGRRDVVATIVGGAAVLLGRGDGSFDRAADLTGTAGGVAVAVADMNGDRTPDVIVADLSTKSVGVYTGTGGARFGRVAVTPVATPPFTMAVTDVNRDGLPDVVTTGEFTVNDLLGRPGGGFVAARASYLPRLTGAGLALADVDRDGLPDLVATVTGAPERFDSPARAAGLAVLRGNGDGTFQTPPAVAEAIDGSPVALVMADFNGDGLLDVAATLAKKPAVAVRLGNGDGTYVARATLDVGPMPLAVASGDLNRDGRADLVVANAGDGTVGVLLGNGDGTYRPQVTFPGGVGACALVVADVNGDAIPDVVVAATGDDAVVTLLGTGDGRLRDTRPGPVPDIAVPPAGETGLGLASVAVGDLNGDGRPDVVFADNLAGTVGVRLGAGDGTFGPAAVTRLPYVPRTVTLGDFDGDRTLDVVVLNTDARSVGLLRGNGDGTFDPTQRTVIVNRPAAVAVGDVNRDGKPDLVVSNADDDTVTVLVADGPGSFLPPRVVPVGLAPGAVALRDVNGDGRADVVVVNSADGTLSTLLSRSDGSFVTATELNGVGRANTPHMVNLTGAVDAAGRPVLDAVVVDGAGTLLFRRGRAGTTELDAPVVLSPGKRFIDAVPLQTADGWVIAAAPREEPLPPDAPPPPGGNYYITLFSVAAGKPHVAGYLTSYSLPTRLYAADLTGSGRADDLVTLCPLVDSIELILAPPDGWPGVPLSLAVGGPPSDVTFADFDGDGLVDIAATDQASGDVTVFFNDAGHTFARRTRVRGGLSPVTLATTSTVSTVVGGAGRVGDGRPATAAHLNEPTALTVDGRGNVYFADPNWNVVRRVDAATGVLTTVAGNWVYGQAGDGGPATSANLGDVHALAVDARGNLFVSESFTTRDEGSSARVRRVDAATGVVTTVPADPSLPWGRAADDAGNEFAIKGDLVRRTDHLTGRKTTIAGAPLPRMLTQLGVGVGNGGGVFFADADTIYRADTFTGRVTPFAGTGTATAGALTNVAALTVGLDGFIYVSDQETNAILRVDPLTGTISTAAVIDGPPLRDDVLAADRSGNVYLADGKTVRRVDATTGAVTTVAANVQFTPAPGRRDEALGYPTPLAFDHQGNLYFADGTTVRRIDAATGAVTTYAGTGVYGSLGDGGPAAEAQLRYIRGLAVGYLGDLYVVDSTNVLRVVNKKTGVITTVLSLGSRFDTLGGIKGLAVDGIDRVLVKGPSPPTLADGPGLVNKVFRVTAPVTTITSAARPVALTAGTFTPDGRADLLVLNRGEHSFSVLAGDGAGGFAAPTAAFTTSTSFARNTSYEAGAVVAGRFTRGGTVDDVAILMRDDGTVWVFRNKGDGTFQRRDVIVVGQGATGLTLVPGADGTTSDLLVGNGSGDVLRLVGDGAGSFAPPPAVTGDRAAIAVQRVGGRAVALVANQQTNTVTVQARQAGGFAGVDSLTADENDAQLAPGDVTWYPLSRGGTQPDAVVLASGSNSVLVYRATGTVNGTPTFDRTPVTYRTGTNPVHVTIADANGDGVPDMLVANAGSNDVSVLFGSYGAAGKWVGTAGPRLRAAGAGPLSADLVANPASPGGSDLAITTRDGKVTVLPGRGQGFFDDASPRVLDLRTPLAPQAPSFIPGLPTGYVVSAGGDVIRFNPAAGTQSVVSTGQNVVLVQAVDLTRVVEVRNGGGVVLATAGGRFIELVPRGALPSAPSGVAVLDFASAALEVLVTSAGDDSIYEYAVRAAGDGSGEPITIETTSELTPADSSSVLVPTLVTTISTGGGGRRSTSGSGFGLLDAAGATGLSADFFTRLGEQADDELVAGEFDALLAILAPVLLGDHAPDVIVGGSTETTREELLDGVADALKRVVEEVQSGERPTPNAEETPVGPALLERLLDALNKLPADEPPKKDDAERTVPPKTDPTPKPAEPGEGLDVRDEPAAGAPARIDWRLVVAAAWVLLGAAPLLHDPDRKAAKPDRRG